MTPRSDDKESIYFASLFNEPFLSLKKRAKLVGVNQSKILDFMKNHDPLLLTTIRRGIVLGYLEDHPEATYREIGWALGVPTCTISAVLRPIDGGAHSQKPVNPRPKKPPKPPKPQYFSDAEHDERMYKRVCIRPEWYVCDVMSRGYCGIVLPPEEFSRYIDLYCAHRRGSFGSYCRVQ